MNAAVVEEAGLPHDPRESPSPPVQTPNKTFFNCEKRVSSQVSSSAKKKKKPKEDSSSAKKKKKPKEFVASKPPTIKPCTDGSNDAEVKRKTGFPTEAAMIAYIIVICGGDKEVMLQRQTSLSCYEE